jgi:peptidyl-Asp metalloendopeptidase
MKSVVWLALALLVPARTAALEPSADLLLPLEEASTLHSSSPSVAAVEWSEALVAASALDATEIGLRLPSRPEVVAVLDRREVRGQGDVTWYGHLLDEPDRRVQLTLVAGHLSGLVYAGSDLFEIVPRLPGVVTVARLDQELFPPCGSDGEDNPGAMASYGEIFAVDGIVAGSVLDLSASLPPAAVEAEQRLDVLVVYTPQAVAGAGSEEALAATIRSAIDSANAAFVNSRMSARFRLVGTALSGRSESGTMATELAWVAHDPQVAALRDQVHADMVSLFTESGDECGRSYVLSHGVAPRDFAPLAFQATRRTCAVGNLSYVHEHGHNLGMQHNPENGRPAGEAAAPWAFGHYVDGSFRTVMSYSTPCVQGCPRVPHFSNPSVSYAGRPTGLSEVRDNHRIGDEIAASAKDWRLDVPMLFGDGFEGGTFSGWSSTTP